jgi:hypothetical protein
VGLDGTAGAGSRSAKKRRRTDAIADIILGELERADGHIRGDDGMAQAMHLVLTKVREAHDALRREKREILAREDLGENERDLLEAELDELGKSVLYELWGAFAPVTIYESSGSNATKGQLPQANANRSTYLRRDVPPADICQELLENYDRLGSWTKRVKLRGSVENQVERAVQGIVFDSDFDFPFVVNNAAGHFLGIVRKEKFLQEYCALLKEDFPETGDFEIADFLFGFGLVSDAGDSPSEDDLAIHAGDTMMNLMLSALLGPRNWADSGTFANPELGLGTSEPDEDGTVDVPRGPRLLPVTFSSASWRSSHLLDAGPIVIPGERLVIGRGVNAFGANTEIVGGRAVRFFGIPIRAESGISKFHVMLERTEDGHWLAFDCGSDFKSGSTNGTSIVRDGIEYVIPAGEKLALENGDVIFLAPRDGAPRPREIAFRFEE